MPKIRVTYPIPVELNHDCERMHIQDYELEEVMLPGHAPEATRKAIRIVIRGRNLRAMAQPLAAFVGRVPVQYLRIAPDERSVEGVLLTEPEPGSYVDITLGDGDVARHPAPFQPVEIQRIK